MQDVVIVPTYDRPEMLWLCLEYLAASAGCQSVQIRVVVDDHVGQPSPPKAEILEVLEKFPQLSIQVGFRQSHHFQGNSFNVLMAYQDALETDAEFVFLIEDDVVIRPEFFRWHRLQHEAQPLGCSIGVVKEPQHGPYVSLGVCFRRSILNLVVPHCQTAYFQDMRGYCKARFEPSKLDCEQDGLWARVLGGLPVSWATTPLAQHVGWYGYHRKRSVRPKGTVEERYTQVKQVLMNANTLKEWVRDFRDIKPIVSPCN